MQLNLWDNMTWMIPAFLAFSHPIGPTIAGPFSDLFINITKVFLNQNAAWPPQSRIWVALRKERLLVKWLKKCIGPSLPLSYLSIAQGSVLAPYLNQSLWLMLMIRALWFLNPWSSWLVLTISYNSICSLHYLERPLFLLLTPELKSPGLETLDFNSLLLFIPVKIRKL